MAFRPERCQGYKPTAPAEAIAEGFLVNIAGDSPASVAEGFTANISGAILPNSPGEFLPNADNGASACPGHRSDRKATSGRPLAQTTTGHVERDCCNGY